MKINLIELYDFSKKLDIQFEELVFLQTIYQVNEDSSNLELIKAFSQYNTRFQYFSRHDSVQPIMWLDLIDKLVEENKIIDLRTPEEKLKNSISINKFILTEEFQSKFLTQKGKEYWWEWFYEMWSEASEKVGDSNIPCVLNTTIFILAPDTKSKKYNTVESIIDCFWREHCLNGQKAAINELFSNTESYLKNHGANIKISKYLETYSSMYKK